MATLLQIEANRRNAAKSTGPTSPQGKQIVAQNARSHGVFCDALLLEGEDSAELAELRDGLLEEINPRSISEKILAERILSAFWRLRRLERAEGFHHLEIANTQRDQLRREGEYPGEREDVQSARACKRMRDYERANDGRIEKRRDWASAQTCPAGLTLANDIVHGLGIVERFGLYEKRLEATLHRAWRELRMLRKDRTERDDRPPAPQSGARTTEMSPAPQFSPAHGPGCMNEIDTPQPKPTLSTQTLQNKANSAVIDAPADRCADERPAESSMENEPVPGSRFSTGAAAG